jgi:hypothetical protein
MIKLELNYLVVFIVGIAVVGGFALLARVIDKKLHGGKMPKDENDSAKTNDKK